VHSQYDEEQIIIDRFGLARVGVYVDIGAGGPIDQSNTYACYQRGWRGLAVEPQANMVAEFRRVRPLDTVLHAAIAPYDGRCQIIRDGGWAALRFLHPTEKVAQECNCLTPASLLARFPEFTAPDLACIDIEGAEAVIVPMFDWDAFRPQMLIVEHDAADIMHDSRPLWEFALLPRYDRFYANQGNSFYWRRP